MNKLLNALSQTVVWATLLPVCMGCATPNTPTPVAPSLLGTWVITVTEENALIVAGQKSGMGQYEITFGENGRVSMVTVGLGEVGQGTYVLTPDRIVMTEESSSCGKAGFPTGTYNWSVVNESLTFTAIEDGCYWRRKSMDGATWTRGTTAGMPVRTIVPMLK